MMDRSMAGSLVGIGGQANQESLGGFESGAGRVAGGSVRSSVCYEYGELTHSLSQRRPSPLDSMHRSRFSSSIISPNCTSVGPSHL